MNTRLTIITKLLLEFICIVDLTIHKISTMFDYCTRQTALYKVTT